MDGAEWRWLVELLTKHVINRPARPYLTVDKQHSRATKFGRHDPLSRLSVDCSHCQTSRPESGGRFRQVHRSVTLDSCRRASLSSPASADRISNRTNQRSIVKHRRLKFVIKLDIINRLADQTGIPKLKAEQAVDALFHSMKEATVARRPHRTSRFWRLSSSGPARGSGPETRAPAKRWPSPPVRRFVSSSKELEGNHDDGDE